MRHYGDSLLRTVTFGVLLELFGDENDSIVTKIIPWAVSNAFYEQIILHYGLENLRPHLPIADSKSLTQKRGDILEAYMAGILMDVSRGVDGYEEIRDWFYNIMRLRLKKLGSSPSQVSALTPETGGIAVDPYSLRAKDPTVLSELRQSIFDNMKKIVGQVQWTSATPSAAQLLDFWSRVKTYLDGLRVVSSEESQMLLVHYYRVLSDLFVSSLLSRT